MATHRYCPECRDFYDHKLNACPDCGLHKSGFNKWLRTAKLDNHLYDSVRAAHQEKADYHAVRTGKKPPEKWAQEGAKRYIESVIDSTR